MTSTRSAIETTVLEEIEIEKQSTSGDGTLTSGPGRSHDSSGMRTRRLSLAAALTAMYVGANLIPIDAFIGGAGFITAGIIILPVAARLLRPTEALVFAVIAPVGLLAFQLSLIPLFSFYGMLIPSVAVLLGSLGRRVSYAIPAAYVTFGAAWYLAFSGGTPLWLAPYVAILAFTLVNQVRPWARGTKLEVALGCGLTTMCEQVTMNIGSISVLGFHGIIWSVIAPFMFVERTVAVLGSSLVVLALIPLKDRLGIGEV